MVKRLQTIQIYSKQACNPVLSSTWGSLSLVLTTVHSSLLVICRCKYTAENKHITIKLKRGVYCCYVRIVYVFGQPAFTIYLLLHLYLFIPQLRLFMQIFQPQYKLRDCHHFLVINKTVLCSPCPTNIFAFISYRLQELYIWVLSSTKSFTIDISCSLGMA